MNVGDTVYSKKQNTELHDSPAPDSPVKGSLDFQQKVAILAVQGRWVQVQGDSKSGWVYSGNLSEKEPPDVNKNDFLHSTAGDTTAATAARPLDEVAVAYGQRRGHQDAVADLKWLEAFADAITPDQVRAYCKENHKGEYAP